MAHQIKVRDASLMTVEDLRQLVRWCDNQTESLWRPGDGDLTAAQILACYHAAHEADYPGMDEWWSEAPDAARSAWLRIVGRPWHVTE